jgi:hypothetical protein
MRNRVLAAASAKMRGEAPENPDFGTIKQVEAIKKSGGMSWV